MKQIYFLLMFLINIPIFSQNIIRSTFSSSGNTIKVVALNKIFYISQTIGQQSVIGSFKNNGYQIKQGFQQSLRVAVIENSNNLDLSVHVFPNPINNKLNIVFNNKLNSDSNIKIYDILGRLQYQINQKNSTKIEIDLSFLSKGIYFMTIKDNQKYKQFKLIKN